MCAFGLSGCRVKPRLLWVGGPGGCWPNFVWPQLVLHQHPCIRRSHSLDHRQLAAVPLQSWQGGHLDSVAQEVVIPRDILSMIAIWLSDRVTQFRQQTLHIFFF